jgi:hypothetical protein
MNVEVSAATDRAVSQFEAFAAKAAQHGFHLADVEYQDKPGLIL